MTQPTTPQPNSSEPHPLIRIANLEAKIIQLEQRLAKLESLQMPEQISLKPTASNSKEDSGDTRMIEIISIDTRLVEANDTWSKIAWKLVIKNLTDKKVIFHANIEFLDKDGFLVDDTFESNLIISAQSEQSFTGTTLIDAPLIERVSSIQAKVEAA